MHFEILYLMQVFEAIMSDIWFLSCALNSRERRPNSDCVKHVHEKPRSIPI